MSDAHDISAPPVTIHGTIDPRFEAIEPILSDSIASGNDRGVSVAVTIDGEFAVDAWGGFADLESTQPWERDTITNVWSSTKTMTNLTALMLADRGAIDLDARVAEYWPEFAANGKQDVLVRHLLAHTSGVSGWEQPITVEDLFDWELSTSRLAAQAPWFEPGSAAGYHAITQGHLVGEVVRRVDGRTLGTVFCEELAQPLGADFHIGLPAEHDHRVSPYTVPHVHPLAESPDRDVQFKTFTGPLVAGEASWTEAWRRAEIGAANGHGNARAMAAVQSIVSNGGTLGGRQYLSPATIDRIFEVQFDGVDLALGAPLVWGIGYGLPSPTTAHFIPHTGRIAFWCGWGGSIVLNDLDRHMTITFAMNQNGEGVVGKNTTWSLVQAIYAALD